MYYKHTPNYIFVLLPNRMCSETNTICRDTEVIRCYMNPGSARIILQQISLQDYLF